MTDYLAPAALAVAAYFVGAIPFAYVLPKVLKGVDVRTLGSGNVGATNASRVLGKKWGLVVYLLDFSKGFGPVMAAVHLPGRFALSSPWPWETAAIAVGAAAVLGHVFPVYLRFRGGKGVATSSGVMLALAPLPTLAGLGVFVLLMAATRYVSLASMAASIALPAAVAAIDAESRGGARTPLLAFTAVTAVAVVVLHRANIRRLLAGTEPRAFSKSALSVQR